jgi:outer membrane protein assembly factor BamB
MDLNKLFQLKTSDDYMCVFLLGLGALLAIVALLGLSVAARRQRNKAANIVGLLVIAILGCGMVGLGAYFRMDLDKLFELKTTEDYMCLLLWGLGALLGGVAVAGLGMAAKQGQGKVANIVALLVVVLLGSGMVGFSTYFRLNRPLVPSQIFPAFIPAAPPADESNTVELTALKSATLGGGTQAVVSGWNQWRGPGRDGVASDDDVHDQLDHLTKEVLWKAPVKSGYSSFALCDGRLYTMEMPAPGKESVLCLDASTGKEIWRYTYGGVDREFGSYSGPRATPAVVDGRVYTVGAVGTLLCLPAKPDGEPKPLWQHNLISEFGADVPGWGIACSPLIDGNLVIVQPGGKKGSVAAYDSVSGRFAWKALDDPNGYSSPVAATIAGVRQIVCVTGRAAAGLKADDGTKLWYYPWPTNYDGNIATPIVAGDYVFISSGYSHGCALLHIQSLDAEMKATPVYVKSNKLMRNHHNTSVFKDGYLYGIDESGLLRCIDLRTGEMKWESKDRANGCPILADGRLIILTDSGTIDIVEATPNKWKRTAQVKDLLHSGPASCWVLPALSDGRLYFRDGNQIVCMDLKKKPGT